jgi:pimeloyl-ACP methyl ester carboxylesterase
MDLRLGAWTELAEAGSWDALFESIARHLKPAAAALGPTAGGTGRLHPRPSTPERFIAELRGTPDPTAFVTTRLAEVTVPTLVIAGGQDQVVPPSVSEHLASGIRGSRFVLDPAVGHAVRAEMPGYHDLVEAFLAEGD